METTLVIILILIGGYLLGSIPSAVWIGKIFHGIDIRHHGSKNAGTTNILRVLGPKTALPVFLIDAGKGYAAVMLSYLSSFEVTSESFILLKIGLVITATLGHIFPIFAKFRGGKGVATIAGSIVALSPCPLLLCFGIFLTIFIITHYVSLGSIVAGLLYPLFLYLESVCCKELLSPTLLTFGIIVAVMLLITHRENIRRLINGTETKTYILKRKNETEKKE